MKPHQDQRRRSITLLLMFSLAIASLGHLDAPDSDRSVPGTQTPIPAEGAATIPPPVADFDFTVTDLTVSFVSTASSDNSRGIWDFGDGNVSRERHPTHTYAAPGSYHVSHTASNAGGSHATRQTVTVYAVAQPLSSLSGNIVFVSNRTGNNEIYRMSADGSQPINLSSHPANDRYPSWSPQGDSILFSSQRDGGTWDIYRLATDSSSIKRLTDTGNNIMPAGSPDGSRIAFVTDRFGDNDIMVMDADGSRQIQLTVDTTNDISPAWSPDSNSVAYVSDKAGDRNIFIIDASNGALILALTDEAENNYDPTWLHDSSRSLLAFTTTRFGNEEIMLVNPLDGSNLRRVTAAATNERQPVWSPDGAWLAFVSDRDNGGASNIYRIRTDGSHLSRLTPDGSSEYDPDWH